MPTTLTVPWDSRLLDYDFGHDHPLAPVRLDLTMELARHLGVFDHDDVAVVPAAGADDRLLGLVHAPDYIDAVRHSAHATHAERLRFGFGTEDNPYFPGMHEASALIVGASVEAARRVWTSESAHAVNALLAALSATEEQVKIVEDARRRPHRRGRPDPAPRHPGLTAVRDRRHLPLLNHSLEEK